MSDPVQMNERGEHRAPSGNLLMGLASGRLVDPLNITPDDIDILDIATALSNQCRYNGHVGGFLSVARHSIWVADRLHDTAQKPRLVLTGLLHDAAEAYLGDMIRPLKHGELGAGYLTVEARVEAAIADRFGIEFPWASEVMAADNYVLMERELGGGFARHTWRSFPADDRRDFLTAFDMIQEMQ